VRCNVGEQFTDVTDMSNVVAKALVTNVLIAAAKAGIGVVAGSPALLSEAAHSVVDSLTEVILLGGAWHERRRPSARYFWGLVASINMFLVGGLWALYEGYTALVRPTEAGDAAMWLGLVVLAGSAFAEATSWLRAVRGLAGQRGGRSWWQLLRTTTDTDIKAVLVEDSADIAGCVLAALGIGLRLLTGSAVWDGLASMIIGVMMIAMAMELGTQNYKLLVRTANA
jgi:cation diffusion facilitator family transporter